MFRILRIVCLLMICGQFSLAHNVFPREKLGTLQVLVPDLAGVKSSFDIKRLQMMFTISGGAKSLEPAAVASVAAGTGCLDITYADVYRASQCGIVIEPQKLTQVYLAAAKFVWPVQQYVTQMGPNPKFIVFTTDTDRKLSGTLDPLKSPDNQPAFLIPEMNATIKLAHEDTGDLYMQTAKLTANTVSEQQIQTPELRATLLLDFIDGAPTFDVIKNRNYLVATYRRNDVGFGGRSHAPTNLTSVVESGPGYGNDGDIQNFYRFSTKGVKQSLQLFPLDRTVARHFYEISINEHIVKPQLKSNQTTRVPVATVNVHHYQTNVPGVFRIFTNLKDKTKLQEHTHPTETSPYYVGAQDFPTESSLFLPIGYMFRLDFYITDALGRRTLQDQVSLDLTTE